MTDFNNIDDLFKEGQSDWNEMPSNAAWDKLSDRLGTHTIRKQHSNRLLIRWAIAASVIAILGLSYFFLNILPNDYNGQLADTGKVNAPEDISKTYNKATEQEETEINTNSFEEMSAATVVEETTIYSIESKPTNGNGMLADHSKTQTKSSPQQTNVAAVKQQIINQSEGNFDKDGIADNAGEASYIEESTPQYLEEITVQDHLEDELLLDREQTVVANYIGIQKEKAERASSAKQKKESDQAATRAAYAYESEEKSQAFINEKNSDKVGHSANEEAISFNNADAVLDKIIYIYYPIENANCQQVTIKLMRDETELDPCDDSELLIEIKNNNTLLKLYELTISDYDAIALEKANKKCNTDSQSLKIVIEYGLIDNRSKVTYFWNIDCPTNSNETYINQLEKLVKDLTQ